MAMDAARRDRLRRGTVIPAHPLALNAQRQLDEGRQASLTRYYLAAGAGGIAVAAHTAQFAIHDPRVGLLRPVLELAADTIAASAPGEPVLRIAGVIGPTRQAVHEAELAAELGYDAVLVSPAGFTDHSEAELLERAAAIGEVLPVIGFYLQEAVGGRYLSSEFWAKLSDQPSTVAVKAAPFDRYRTLELVEGVVHSGRGEEVALYTGNDDNIVADLLAPFVIPTPGGEITRRFVGGLLGHWAVWTRSAVRLRELAELAWRGDVDARSQAAALSAQITAANAAVFDVRNGFSGVIAGVHEVLRLQGLLEGIWCLDPAEGLSPGQSEAIREVIENTAFLREEQDFISHGIGQWYRG